MGTGRAGLKAWAIAVCVASIQPAAGLSGQHPGTDLALLGYVLMASGGLALAASRRTPVPVMAVTGLCPVGYQAAGSEVPAVAFPFAVYAAVRAGHHEVTAVASVTLPVALPLAVLVSPLDKSVSQALAQARNALRLTWLIAAAADSAPLPGVGLLGTRGRVTALGGRLRAEPRSSGGFTVQAGLPMVQTS